MQTTFLQTVAGTDENTGQSEVVVFAGGTDLEALVGKLARDVGELMVEHAPSPRFGAEIRVVWMPTTLPRGTAERGIAELQSRVCEQILRLDVMPARDIKLSFQVGL